ncbi:MAG: succinate dehydrogenase cytochrome b subunit [Acidobacteriota bacterium]
MKKAISFYQSSVGKKIVMSLAGLFLCSFLVIHLIGNLALFKNDNGESFIHYSEFMSTNPVIKTTEILLFGGFVIHILIGTVLWFKNRAARPAKYSAYKLSDNVALPSRIVMLSGSIVLLFLVVHLKTFFYPSRILGVPDSMYQLVIGAFSNPWYDLFYLVSLVLLGYHLKHAFQSAFQTLGLRNGKYITLLDAIAVIFWLLIPLGFATMPIYFFLSTLK